jgi:hypothetical protein
MKFNDWIELNMLRKIKLAERLEISKTYLYYIVDGKRRPGKELMEKIQVLTKGKVRKKDFL